MFKGVKSKAAQRNTDRSRKTGRLLMTCWFVLALPTIMTVIFRKRVGCCSKPNKNSLKFHPKKSIPESKVFFLSFIHT
jgi:hypothetical protein